MTKLAARRLMRGLPVLPAGGFGAPAASASPWRGGGGAGGVRGGCRRGSRRRGALPRGPASLRPAPGAGAGPFHRRLVVGDRPDQRLEELVAVGGVLELLLLLRVADEAELDEHGRHRGALQHAEGGLLDAAVLDLQGLVELPLDQVGEALALGQVVALREVPEDEVDVLLLGRRRRAALPAVAALPAPAPSSRRRPSGRRADRTPAGSGSRSRCRRRRRRARS